MDMKLLQAEPFVKARAVGRVQVDGHTLMAAVYVTDDMLTDEVCRPLLVEKFARGEYINWSHANGGVDPSATFGWQVSQAAVSGVYPAVVALAFKPYPLQPPLAVA